MFTDKQIQAKKTGQEPSLFFQPKLSVNQPGDVHEQEADAFADSVMRMGEPPCHQSFFKATPVIQRKCQHCEEEEKQIHRKESSSETKIDTSTEKYIHSLSGGRQLDESERNFFEPRMGYDLSGVRLHAGAEANQSAKGINALAYTYGSDIVFGASQY